MSNIKEKKEQLLKATEDIHLFYHSTFDDFDTFDFSKSSFGMHFGTKESAINRIDIKILEDEKQGGYVLEKKKDNPILIKADLEYKNPLKLKENRTGNWTAHDILREVMEQAEIEGINGITEDEIDDYYVDELSLDGILFTDVGFEDEYDGEEYNQQVKEQYFIRNFLESKGYDSIVYDNEFEKGGQSIIVFRPEQINIVEKINLNNDQKNDRKLNKKIKP